MIVVVKSEVVALLENKSNQIESCGSKVDGRQAARAASATISESKLKVKSDFRHLELLRQTD